MKPYCWHPGKKFIAFTALSVFSAALPALAATRPDTGTILDNAKPPAAQQPIERQTPAIAVEEQPVAPAADGGQKFFVSAFRIRGETPVPADELLKIVQNEAGKESTLGELNRLTGKITQYLRWQGYLVAFAYLPAQDIRDGVVEIAVVPGTYGQVNITGNGPIAPDRLRAMLFAARPGAVITREPLERALLLINDLAGVHAQATLSPGKEAGTADLTVETSATAKTSGALYSDNWGSRYTGRTRYGTQLRINNLSGAGDALTVGGMTTRDGIDNYNFGYNIPVGADGATFDLSYSHVGYTLGDSFASLGATGRAAVTGYQLSYPLTRSRSASLYGSFGYDHKQLRDDLTGYGSYNPRTSGLWHIALSGNSADTWLGGGTNSFSLTQYWGSLDLTDAASLATDAATAQTDGHFTKTVLNYRRQQAVAQNLNFNLSFTGQLAGKNLDSSEKLYLGGADGVRAYPQGEGGGDQGYKLTGELRWLLPGASAGHHNLYLNTFYDYGHVMTNKDPYSIGDNSRSLAAAGLGLLWVQGSDFTVRLDYAWKAGQETATADTDKNGRCWLQAVKYF
ncbi:ShlB/FhaC/HecB family hemolysin secretion/activation protein [Pelosinus propionicus]|uniref:ShlB/FhaC/HecB family hemolysin secretion/activation protein n=1 Tax=Pelosinus propionicus TaxID=380084 RepID=UPI000B8592F8|nr:ShlB/FhaC/HecB family hemolysin secretion/activation protein [Pelosinus propionicus]